MPVLTCAAFKTNLVSNPTRKHYATNFQSEIYEFLKNSSAAVPLKSLGDNHERATKFYDQFGGQIQEIVHRVLLNKLVSSANGPPTLTNLLKKNDEISNSFREQGNTLFKQKKVTEALKYYTLACRFALPGSRTLALAYSNRSACFTEMKQMTQSLQDIQRFESLASSWTNPDDIKIFNKIMNRKQKCQDFIAQAKEQEEGKKKNQEKEGLDTDYFRLKSPSSSIPSAEDFIGICDDDDERGRNVRNIGKHTIQPGTLVILDQPYSKVLLNTYNFQQRHCSACLKDLGGGGYPCPNCVFQLYCSNECMSSSSHTEFECKIAPYLHELNLDRNSHLALVTLLKQTPQELSKWTRLPSTTTSDHPPGFVDGVYSSTSYYPILKLMYHEPLITESDLMKYLCLGVTISELLESETTYFSDLEIVSLQESKVLFASLMLLHLMNFPCNTHALYHPGGNSGSQVEIGAGAFALLSMINHSCDPNVVRVTLPNGLTAVISLTHILPNQELLDNYGHMYAIEPKPERIKGLLASYNFTCACPACTEDWGDINHLMRQPDHESQSQRICAKCVINPGVIVPLEEATCKNCKNSLSVKEDDIVLAKYKDSFQSTYEHLTNFGKDGGKSLKEIFSIASDGLKYFDGNFKKPNKFINMYQEMVKQCLVIGTNPLWNEVLHSA